MLSLYNNKTEYVVDVRVADHIPLSPIVGVTCEAKAPDVYNRIYVLDLGDEPQDTKVIRRPGVGPPNLGTEFQVDIRTVWNESLLASSKRTMFTLKDVTTDENYPALHALLLRPGDQYGAASLTLCSVQASWSPTNTWIHSAVSNEVLTSFDSTSLIGPTPSGGIDEGLPRHGDDIYQWPYELTQSRIHIHEDWVNALNALNARNGSSNAATMEVLLEKGLNTAYVTNATTTKWVLFYPVISQLLSKAVADGLSRIGSEYATPLKVVFADGGYVTSVGIAAICCKGWCSEGKIFRYLRWPNFLNGTWDADSGYGQYGPVTALNGSEQLLRSFPQPPDIDVSWTRISFPFRRYGYAYSMSSKTTKVAAAILIFHALVSVCHVIYVIIFDGRTYKFGSSLGDLVVLALGRAAPARTLLSENWIAVRPAGDYDGDQQWILVAGVHIDGNGARPNTDRDESKDRGDHEASLSGALQSSRRWKQWLLYGESTPR